MKTRFNSILMLLAAALCLPAAWAAPAGPAPVAVLLTVEKKAPTGQDGQPKWLSLGSGKAVVLPGDALRYTVTASSHLARPIRGFVLTQPVPRGMEYQASSASASGDARLTASLDGGKTFAEKPTVRVTHPDGSTDDEPAPASRYTTLRWTFLGDLPPMGCVSAHCEVRIR